MDETRTNTQKLLTLHVDEVMFEAVEQARGRVNRSQWIREAIAEKALREGVKLPEMAIYPPDRARKGGNKWTAETLRKTTGKQLNGGGSGQQQA